MTLMTRLTHALLALALTGTACGHDPAKVSATDQTIKPFPSIAAEAVGAAGEIVTAVFNPIEPEFIDEGGYYDVTLEVYVHSLVEGAQVMSVWIVSPEGLLPSRQVPVTVQPAPPGWISVSTRWYQDEVSAGAYMLTIWLEMNTGDVTNTVTAPARL